MFDHAGRYGELPTTLVGDDIDSIVSELTQLGFDPPPLSNRGQSIVCGTSFRVALSTILGDRRLADELLDTLCGLIGSNVPVCLVPDNFPAGVSPIDAWTCFCELVKQRFHERSLCASEISICMHSHRMPLEAFCLITDSLLGFGSRFVFLDSLQMASHCDSRVTERTASNWRFLWRFRGASRPVQPVYGGLVRSSCRLLADEIADAVIPSKSLLVPAGSAWLPIGMVVTRFCHSNGKPDRIRLKSALRRAVDLADQLMSRLEWLDPRQRTDAANNRRLAVCVTGLGDLLLQNGRSPTALDSLEWLTDLVRTIRCELSSQSTKLAAGAEMLPALQEMNPVSAWIEGPDRARWLQQWELAVRQSAVRHRNLLVLSPSSVLPRNGSECTGFADLLPVLGIADAWSFDTDVKMQGFSMTQFRDFHRRARATIQSAQRASFIAAGV